mgnify:FL=1
MSCGVEEYWIVNPLNREVMVYLFKDNDFDRHITFKGAELAQSFIFPGLNVELERIFK